MKSGLVFVILIVSFASALQGQPLISNNQDVPEFGFMTTMSQTGDVSSVGDPGADQIWDFSGHTFSEVATIMVIDPAKDSVTIPALEYFPSLNYAWRVTPMGQDPFYTFMNKSTNKMETLADNISATTGKVYTNPQTSFVWPFAFGDSVSDTYQHEGNDENPVTVIYDGYGTLKTADGETPVIRVRLAFTGGSDYVWYTIDPLFPAAIYSYSGQKLSLLTQQSTTGVLKPRDSGNLRLIAENLSTREFRLYSINGKTNFGLSAGVYFDPAPWVLKSKKSRQKHSL